jgi:PAS domain S-box-containing protein
MTHLHKPQKPPGLTVVSAAKRSAARHPEVARYRSLVEFTSDWVWEVDPNARYTFSNRAVTEILGYPPEEVIGRTPFDFMPPPEADRISQAFSAISKAKKPFFGLENVNRHKSGRRVVLETSGIPIFDERGRFLGYTGVDRDVTVRKKIEEDLRKAREELAHSEHQFQSLVETLNEGIGIADAEGRLTYVNPKLLDMIGYARHEVVGKKTSDFMDDRNRRLHKKQLALRQRGIETPYEIQLTTRDAKTIETIVSPRATFDADGRFQGSFAVITDIRATKRAQKALRRREQQLREKTLRLQEMNTALEVLLRKREQDKAVIQKRILGNIRRLVAPYLDALGETRLSERQRLLVELLKSNLREAMSPFSEMLTSGPIDLTRTELEVANLVRMGKSTTQIAAALNMAYKTAETHRWRIRKKLGLTHKKANLMSLLSQMQNPVFNLRESCGKNQV